MPYWLVSFLYASSYWLISPQIATFYRKCFMIDQVDVVEDDAKETNGPTRSVHNSHSVIGIAQK